MLKLCTKCLVAKETSEFGKSIAKKDGLQGWCKNCHNAANREAVEKRKKFGPTIIRTSKQCKMCLDIKPIGQFFVRRSSADGYGSYCKPCWQIKTRAAQKRGR